MKILWRKVKIFGFEHYQISNDGVLLNTKTGNLTIGHNTRSALNFTLYYKGTVVSIAAHLLVLHHFKKKELDKNYGVHLDYNKQNNRAANLEWATFGEVLGHAKRKKNELKGRLRGIYKIPKSILTKKKWRAALTIGKGKTKTLGYYHTKKEAIVAYSKAYEDMYGVEPFVR